MKNLLKPVFMLALLFAGTAMAQPALFVEGTHYDTLAKPVRTANPNKIEVTEIFWYGCPHCYRFETLLDNWIPKLPSDVAFVRSPGMWNPMMETHAQIFYTEQALGCFDKTHKAIFDAIQLQNNRLDTKELARALFVKQGIDPAAFDKAWDSFAVTSGVKQAQARMKEYGVNGVPAFIVNGKYRVSGREGVMSEAAMHEEMLKIVDFLIAKERAARK